jgi:6-phosphogluconolactonase
MNKQVKIYQTSDDLAETLAKEFSLMVSGTATGKAPFMVALSGGNTPKQLFNILGDSYSDAINWNNIHFFWVDERCVSPTDPDSNFRMTNEALLKKIKIPVNNVHRIQGESDPDAEAFRYSGEISNIVPVRNGIPCFDLTLLGIGEDGHTASIFPGNNDLFDTVKICSVALHPVTGQKRITLTGKVINNSSRIIFMVTGRNKASVTRKIIAGEDPEKQFPASFVEPVDGKLYWYIDSEAGSLL